MLAGLFGLATYAYAARATPLVATFLDNLTFTGAGVSDDGNPVYTDGSGGVRCYFGVNGRDVDLVTYNSGRTLNFTFDPNSPGFKASGLPASFNAESDLFGINYFGPYRTMGVGTTAQVQMDLEFHVGSPPQTFELDYSSLAVKRLTSTTWLVTSNQSDIGGNPGFTASDLARLNGIRRKTVTAFGAVNMPIRFEVTLK
jgi:hypothetical protein